MHMMYTYNVNIGEMQRHALSRFFTESFVVGHDSFYVDCPDAEPNVRDSAMKEFGTLVARVLEHRRSERVSLMNDLESSCFRIG